MKNIVSYTLVSLFAYTTLLAQKHDFIWLGGGYSKNFKLDFNQFPVKLESLDMDYYFQSHNVSISNEEGKLDFYSDGCTIRNRRNQTMENGHNFNYDTTYKRYCEQSGYYPARKGILALPNSTGYLLFYISVNFASNKCSVQDFLVAQIDMSANSGLGKMTWKDSFLLKDLCLQDASATRHANGRDWWIILGSNKEPLYYRFLYQPDMGIQGPWVQYIENPLLDDYYYNGWSSFSPDGNKYASLMNRVGIALYEFNRCTGLLSNMRFIESKEGSPNAPSLSFSSNSRYIYQTWQQGETVIQYDTQTDTVKSSRAIISTPIKWLYQAMSMGPDGKIYVWCGSFSADSCASVINFPNRKGSACNLIERSLRMPELLSGFNLYYPNYRLGPIDGSACDTLNINNLPKALWRHDIEDAQRPLQITFTDLSYYEPEEWRWDFGDGGSSRDTSPIHAYAQAGSYKVCLVAKNQYASDTLCKVITIGASSMGEPLPTQPSVSIFPNPADNYVQIGMDMVPNDEPVVITFFNAIGVPQLDSQFYSNTTRIETANLPSGTYFVRAVRGEKTLFVRPIAIQH